MWADATDIRKLAMQARQSAPIAPWNKGEIHLVDKAFIE